MVAQTAFDQEDRRDAGPPNESGPKGPTKEELGVEAFRKAQADEKAEKAFNRVKMGGFLMEFGFNILASNRDDAGGAIGEGYNATTAARDKRARVASADKLAASERERKHRRENESDILKEEKAAREVKQEERAVKKGERDELVREVLTDGTVGYYKVGEGTVYRDKERKHPIKVDRKDRDRISANNVQASVRLLQSHLIKERELIAESEEGWDMSKEEIRALAKENVKANLRDAKQIYSEQDVDDFDEDTLPYDKAF